MEIGIKRYIGGNLFFATLGTTTPSVVHCSQVLFVYKRLNYDVNLCIALFCECKRVDPKLYIKWTRFI